VWHAGDARAQPRTAAAVAGEVVPEDLVLRRAAQQALALAQQEKSTWTRADVVKYLGRVLPRTGRDPDQVRALLEELADRVLRVTEDADEGGAGGADVGMCKSPAAGLAAGLWW
jgi:hypothetical protein